MKKIIKAIKKTHCCNGTIVEDEEMGNVLQFQGDQRDNVLKFLLENGARAAPACLRLCGPVAAPGGSGPQLWQRSVRYGLPMASDPDSRHALDLRRARRQV